MGGLARITGGILQKMGDIISPVYNVKRIYYPLRIDISERKPVIELRFIKKRIDISATCICEEC